MGFFIAWKTKYKNMDTGKMKKLIYIPILVVFVMLPVSPALAQVPVDIDRQIIDAVDDLEPDARLEFLELIRDPGQWEEVFEELGVVPELADEIEDRLAAWDDGHQQEQAFKKLETLDDKIERKLANIKDGQIGKAEKTIEKALKKADKVLAKIEKKQDKDKDKDKDKDTLDPEPDPDDDDDKDKKDKKK